MTASPSEILKFQKNLIRMNCLPGVPDGAIGTKTTNAAKDAAAIMEVPWVKGGSWELFMEQVEAWVAKLPVPAVPPPSDWYDLSAIAGLPTWIKGDRLWTDIDHFNIHQTGAPMGRDPERWLALRAHFGITTEGEIYQIRPLLKWGYDAQGLSRRGIGIEIAGFFCGEEGQMKTRPGGPKEWKVTSITPKQVEAAKALMRWLCALVAHHGGKIKGCYPHRVATDDRTFDPGSKAWQLVGVAICKELGLTDGGAGYIVKGSQGEPIPGIWDPSDPAKAKIPLINSRKALGLK